MTIGAGEVILATDILYIYNRTVAKPACRVVQQAAQTLTDNTATTILFGADSEDYDTHSMHSVSTNTGRITVPAGYDGKYRAFGVFAMEANADYNSLEAYLAVNGSPVPTRKRVGPNTVASARTIDVSATLDLVAGDYVELVGLQDDASGTSHDTSSTGGSFSCVLELLYESD